MNSRLTFQRLQASEQRLRSALSKAHARRRRLVAELDLALLAQEEERGTCSPTTTDHSESCLGCAVLGIIRKYRRAS